MLRKPPKVGDLVWIYEPDWDGPGTCIHCVIVDKVPRSRGGFSYKLQETVFRHDPSENPIKKTYARLGDNSLFDSLEDAARDEAEYRYRELLESSNEYNEIQQKNKEAWFKYQAELQFGAGI